MKRISMALLALMLLVGVGQTVAQVRVVFVGDSITRIFNDCNAEWFTENNFSRHGYAGRTTSWMLKGFKDGVLNKNPQCIVIGAGTNDIAQNDNVFVSVDHIYANIVNMVEQAKAAGIKVIMTTALNEEKNVKMAFELGCTVYSGKPIDQDKFEQVLKKFGLI